MQKMRCFLEKFTQLARILHDRRSRRLWQISSLHKYSLLLHLCVLLEFFGSCKLHTVHFIFWCTCLWFNHFLFPVKFLLHSSQGYSLSASWQFLMCCFIDCLVLNVLPQVSQMKKGSIVSEEFCSRLNFLIWFVNIYPLMDLVVTTTMTAYALHYD